MKKTLLIVLTMAFFVSCSDEETAQETHQQFLTQSKSGNCGLDVVSDYNSAVLSCRSMFSRTDIEQCISKLQRFKRKYPSISCTAERGYGLDKETFTISVSHINGLISEAQNL